MEKARGARFFAETPFLGYGAWRKQAAFSIAVRDRLIRLAFCLCGAELDDFPGFALRYLFHFRSRLEAIGNVKRNNPAHNSPLAATTSGHHQFGLAHCLPVI